MKSLYAINIYDLTYGKHVNINTVAIRTTKEDAFEVAKNKGNQLIKEMQERFARWKEKYNADNNDEYELILDEFRDDVVDEKAYIVATKEYIDECREEAEDNNEDVDLSSFSYERNFDVAPYAIIWVSHIQDI